MFLSRLTRRAREEFRLSGQAAWRGIVRMFDSDDLTHAAAISFYALLSLFPFLLLVVSLLGLVAADEQDRMMVLRFVLRYFPARVEFVNSQLNALSYAGLQVGLAGGLGLAWASLGVFAAVTHAVNEAWGVEKRRSFWKHRLVSFVMMGVAGGVMMAALLVISIVRVAQASWLGEALGGVSWLGGLESLALRYAATLLLITATGLVYYFVPNTKIRFRDVWVGAILTGALWRLTFGAFSWYIGRSGRLALIPGSVAAIVVFLMWVYVSAVVFMYGVEFTAAHARFRRRGGQTARHPAA